MQQIATYETVAKACEQLKSEGQKVTGRAVLAITGGSLGTVLRYIKKWRECGIQALPGDPLEIPKDLKTSILHALEHAQAQAATQLKEEIEQSNAREAEALDGLKVAEAHAEKLKSDLRALREELNQERQNGEKSHAVAAEKIRALEDCVQDLRVERSRLIEAGESARTETVKVLLRFEQASGAINKAESRILELEKELQSIRNQKAAVEKAQAVAEQRGKGLADQLTDARAALAESKAENNIIFADQKKEIQELKAKNAELEKKISTLSTKKA